MKTQAPWILAAALAALAGCSSPGAGQGSDMGGATSAGASGTEGSTASGTSASGAMGAGSQAGMRESGIVMNVESMPGGSSSMGGTGGASAAGTRAGATGGTGAYRLTLRMDDGSTRTLTQDWAPGVRVGDRVTLENGALPQAPH
ncbi:MAG: hypothetical protein ACXU8N_20290 [Telluria sp.]